MNKKAVTPLISTIILIVFAAALGAVVISWGNSEQFVAAEAECDDVSLSIVEIDDIQQVCYRNGEIEFTAQNEGEADITGVKMVVIGEADITSMDVTGNVLVGDVVRETVKVDNVGTIQKVILTPKISQKTCAKNSFGADNVGECK